MIKIKEIFWSLKAYYDQIVKNVKFYRDSFLFLISNLIKYKDIIGVYNLHIENVTFNLFEFIVYLNAERKQKNKRKLIIFIIDHENKLDINNFREAKDYLSYRFRYFNLCLVSLKNFRHINIIINNKKIFSNFKKILNIHSYDVLYHKDKILEFDNNNQLPLLSCENSEIDIVLKWLKTKKINKEKLITLTLRNSSHQTFKNTTNKNWIDFFNFIKSKGFSPVIIPDADTYSFNLDNLDVFEVGTFNLNIRNAIYELSLNNYFVESGNFMLAHFFSANYSIFQLLQIRLPHI